MECSALTQKGLKELFEAGMNHQSAQSDLRQLTMMFSLSFFAAIGLVPLPDDGVPKQDGSGCCVML